MSTIEEITRDFVGQIEAEVNARVRARLHEALEQLAAGPAQAAAIAAADRVAPLSRQGLVRSTRFPTPSLLAGDWDLKMLKARPATAAHVRSRKLQGEYLGLLRKLTGAKRARVQKAARTGGVAEGIKAARAALR